MGQKHVVVIPKGDGGVEIYPMKHWLRQHPEHVPAGYDGLRSTSHQLRGLLMQAGWTMQEGPGEVRMIFPGSDAGAVVEDLLGAADESASDDEDGSPYFSLEYQLRDFLASNLPSIDFGGKRLRVFVDPKGDDGVEYPTAVGPIDILAVDENGDFYVLELKRAQSSDRTFGQIARYMGWVKQTIGHEKNVFGIIVSKSVSENLKYARSIVPNVFLYEYAVSFSVRPAHDLRPSDK